MLIDWFTVGAQILNFVVLVALLKRFLYRPVLAAIDARESRIARQIADAQALHESATKERDEFQHRQADFDGQRAALLKQASLDADAEGRRLLDAARAAADAASARRRDAERESALRLRRSLADRSRDEVFAIARKTLADLADATLDERVAAVLLRRVATLDAATRQVLVSGLDPRAPRAIVRSAFEAAPAQREALRAAVAGLLGTGPSAPIDVVFEVAPDLLAGIELVIGGQKTGWNIAHYLDSLEHVFDEVSAPAADVSPRGEAARTPVAAGDAP